MQQLPWDQYIYISQSCICLLTSHEDRRQGLLIIEMLACPLAAGAQCSRGLLSALLATCNLDGRDAGRREWAPIQKWCHKHMETALRAWFGNVEVVREGTTPFDPEDKYIFGYAPHGLFPIGGAPCPGITVVKAAVAQPLRQSSNTLQLLSTPPCACNLVQLKTLPGISVGSCPRRPIQGHCFVCSILNCFTICHPQTEPECYDWTP